MAFPVIASSALKSNTTFTTSHTIAMPASVASGDILVVFLRFAWELTITFPNDWTVQIEDTSDAANDKVMYAWKVSDGTEGASITVTSSSSDRVCGGALRITGGDSAALTDTFLSITGTYTEFTPSGGAKDRLWLYWGSNEGESPTVSALPTNFTNIGAGAVNTGGGGAASTNTVGRLGYRNENAASITPTGTPAAASTIIMLSIPEPSAGGSTARSFSVMVN